MGTWSIIAATAVVTYTLSLIIRALTSHEKKIQHEIQHQYPVGDEQFLRSVQHLLPPQFTTGNKVDRLVNGDQIFPAMLDAIRGAQRTIVFETFIYWQGDIGRRFVDALGERAQAGVKVHVLLDWLGSKRMDQQSIERLKGCGAQVERYHPLHWYNLRRANHRTHRKLLVIDGRIGFTGGVGIADEWMGDAQDPQHWRDTHFRVEGPAVAQMQAAFMDNWLKTHQRVLHGPDYFPKLEPAGSCTAQMFMSSPEEGSESARLMFLMSIACVAKSLRIASAYFVPDDLSVQELVNARKRGARVQIVVPGEHIDAHVVRRASRARWGPLLEAGIEIYEYQPTMFHCKVLIADEQWTSVGSANFDTRSFRLNDEANLNIYDVEFAERQAELFEADLKRAHRVTLEEWQNRPWMEKLMEHAAALLRAQL
ncbi:MAG TPA: phospholipase D-like domain-containing protein [Tepidisphaeraceae bacterium]|jgi:cardiolipin synthase|nr:phospholipase D-like domain-containing protein [Tepidisphaeraceae bacterium]